MRNDCMSCFEGRGTQQITAAAFFWIGGRVEFEVRHITPLQTWTQRRRCGSSMLYLRHANRTDEHTKREVWADRILERALRRSVNEAECSRGGGVRLEAYCARGGTV